MNIEEQSNDKEVNTSPPPPVYESVGRNVISSIRNTVSNVADNVSQTLSSGKETIVRTQKSYGYMVFIGIFVAIILFLIAYGLYVYIRNLITQKTIFEFPDSQTPMKGTAINRLNGTKIPANVNGKRKTLMFWIYINDINMFSGEDIRHIMHIGDETILGSSPSVYLDGMKNRIYVRFSKKGDNSTNDNLHTHATNLVTNDTTLSYYDAIKTDLATRGVVIDYVPLQRWVHVAIVINETVNRGYISTYLDGEIVSHVTSDDVIELSNGDKITVDFTGLNLDKTGDLYIGSDIYNNNMPRGFSGLISRVSIANFDMNGIEVKKVFYKGPIDGIINKMGIPYGVRNPIYKIE